MATFPETVKPLVPYEFGEEYRTVVSPDYENGAMFTRSVRDFGIFWAKLTYGRLSVTEALELYEFLRARKGRYGSFDFIDFNGWDSGTVGIPWVKLYVGVGDGSTTVFDLPMKTSSSYTLYKNDVAQTYTTHWTLGSGTGAAGRDRATFVTAPTAGHIISFSATGRRVATVRCLNDVISMQNLLATLYTTGLAIREVR